MLNQIKNTFFVTALTAASLLSLPAQAGNPSAVFTVGALPRGMAISANTSSLLSMDTIEAVSLKNVKPGNYAEGQLQFLGASGQWYHTLLGATWTMRQPNLTQQVRASMVFTRFNGLYDSVLNSTVPESLISHIGSFGLHYATRQSMDFVRPDFAMIYEAGLQYNSLDLRLFPDILGLGSAKLSTGLTRMEFTSLAQQDFPLRPYASLRAFAGLSLAYRHLGEASSSEFGSVFLGKFKLDSQNFLESRVLGGVELEYHDENLIPQLFLNARFSLGIRINDPSLGSVTSYDDQGDPISLINFNFGADNIMDTQLALKARYELNEQLTVGANLTLFYQGCLGSSIGGQLSYAF